MGGGGGGLSLGFTLTTTGCSLAHGGGLSLGFTLTTTGYCSLDHGGGIVPGIYPYQHPSKLH